MKYKLLLVFILCNSCTDYFSIQNKIARDMKKKDRITLSDYVSGDWNSVYIFQPQVLYVEYELVLQHDSITYHDYYDGEDGELSYVLCFIKNKKLFKRVFVGMQADIWGDIDVNYPFEFGGKMNQYIHRYLSTTSTHYGKECTDTIKYLKLTKNEAVFTANDNHTLIPIKYIK